MKKTDKNPGSKRDKGPRKRVSIIIDKKLDTLSKRILFGKKLEKANDILSGGGIPV